MEAIEMFNLDLEKLLCGYILGYAKLLNVIIYNSEEEFMKDKNKHLSIHKKTKYPVYGFVLGDVHRIEPIEYKGKLSFFKVQEIKFNNLHK